MAFPSVLLGAHVRSVPHGGGFCIFRGFEAPLGDVTLCSRTCVVECVEISGTGLWKDAEFCPCPT